MRKMGLFKPLYPIGEGCDIMCNNFIDNLSPYIPLQGACQKGKKNILII